MSLRAWLKEQGLALGFQRVGIAPATDLPELGFFPGWQERGYAGALHYMHNPRRQDVRRLLSEARSVICCALAYDTARPRSTEVAPDPERGWISRYAWGDDYHGIVEEKLEALRARIAERVGAGFQAKLYVDTGPVLERVYGKYAGLGWQAKNTCLLDAELGSFFFVGVLVTNLDLEPDEPLPDGCGSCTLCLEACPTGAIVEPYVLDARRCISYLTIELRDSIPVDLREPMGRHVFGCDICQDVCPYNRRAWLTDLTALQPRQIENPNREQGTRPQIPAATTSPDSFFHPRLDWLANLNEKEYRRVFKDSPVKRARWRGLLRNVLVAMGNSGNSMFRPLLERFAVADDPLLAEHARWALDRLRHRRPKGQARQEKAARQETGQ